MPVTKPTSDAIQIAQLQITVQHLATLVEKANETMEGTNRTKGLKEKITIAELNIEANKQAYLAVMEEVRQTEKRLGISMMESTNTIKNYIEAKFAEAKRESDVLKAADIAQQTFLDKIKPWISGLQWLITLVAGVVVTMIVTGKLHLGYTP